MYNYSKGIFASIFPIIFVIDCMADRRIFSNQLFSQCISHDNQFVKVHEPAELVRLLVLSYMVK